MRALRGALVAAMGLALVGCPTTEVEPPTPPPPDCEDDDFTAPEIRVQNVEDGQPIDAPVPVFVEVVDDDGTNTVLLYHRTQGVADWNPPVFLSPFDGQENVWTGEIPGIIVQEPGVDWYIQASDTAQCQSVAHAPPDAPESWFNFSTEITIFPLPITQNFDSPNCSADIDDLGWSTHMGSFPQEIHAWRTDARTPLSGECSASHSEGIPGGVWECPEGGAGIERDNWLISPAMDFTTKDSIAVRWFERHRRSGICPELHELYVSTGSPAVDGPDWVLLETDLPLPGSAWQSSAWYDLGDYVGEERVYVAIRYLGGSAGRWQVDDFYIGEPLADLVLAEEPTLDASVGPGSTGIELALTVTNVSDRYPAPALTATLTTGDDNLTITSADSTLPALGVGESAPVADAFVFDVGAAHPDNAYLDFGLVLDDGEGHSWTIPIRMLMGQESYLTIVATTPLGADIDLEVGYGPLVEPAFSLASSSEDHPETEGDVHTWRFDITEHAARLPPGPGDKRWYLEWENRTIWPGTVESMTFEVGGVETGPDELPADVPAGAEGFLQFPRPPSLSVVSFETSPDPAAPGGQVALQNIVLRNDGAPTAGPVACIGGSSNPNAVNFSTTPSTFGGAALGTGETASSDSDITFEIAPQHTDNTDIEVVLVCTDGFDAMTPSVFVPVPYPMPTATGIRIDDPTGNNDGFADPSEAVDVFITLTNEGAFATSSAVTAVLTPAPNDSSAVFVAPATTSLTFGNDPLDPGASVEADQSFAVSVDAGNLMGDSMVFDAVYTSGGDTWTEQVTVEVTGLPWNPCGEADDPQGDVLEGADFDIKGCSSRSDGDILQVRVESWTPYNPATTALWFLLYEVPSLYSIEWVPPGLDFEQGCVGGDDIANPVLMPTVSHEGNSGIVRLHLDDLNEIGRNVSVAFGAGYCPGANDYCDSYPAGAAAFSAGAGVCNESLYIPISW